MAIKQSSFSHNVHALIDWEIITGNLKKAGFSVGWVSALDDYGRTVWIVDAHRGDGKCFVVRADEKNDCVSGIGINNQNCESHS